MEGTTAKAEDKFGDPLPFVLGKLDDGFNAIELEWVFPLLGDDIHSGSWNALNGSFAGRFL